MASPVDSFVAAQHQIDSYVITIPQTFAMPSQGNMTRTLSCWKMSTPTDANTDDMYDFYLIQEDAQLTFNVSPTLYNDGYDFQYQILDANGNALSDSVAELQDSLPESTPTSETISSSMTKTISSSFGFFGDDMTGSVGFSVTMGQSTSQTISGLSVTNHSSDSVGGNNAAWRYSIADFSGNQIGKTAVCNQMFFRVLRSLAPAGIKIQTNLRVFVSDHDGSDGTHYFDSFAQGFNTYPVSYTDDRVGYFDVPEKTTDVIPPPVSK